MPSYFDTLELRDPAVRERDLLLRLPAQVAHAKANAPAYAIRLAGIEPAAITSRAALATLPVTRKSELLELQKAKRPFGGFAATGWGSHVNRAQRVFASPGPLYEPETTRPDYWRLARALVAAGFRQGDLVHNTFSYHFTPAGSMVETAALALGCTVFPAGVGQTEMQVQAIAELQPDGYVGTPSFLKIILEKADETGADVSSLKKALVSGEAFPPSLRDTLSARGIAGYQAYATADLGSIAYETEARSGLVVDEGVIVEIVRPGTGDPVAAGEVGEVVVTTFNPDYPLLRFGTGDLSAVIPESIGYTLFMRADQHPLEGMAGARRPDDQGQGPVRSSVASRRYRAAASGDREGADDSRQPGRQRSDDLALRSAQCGTGPGGSRCAHHPRNNQAARRSPAARTGHLAE